MEPKAGSTVVIPDGWSGVWRIGETRRSAGVGFPLAVRSEAATADRAGSVETD